MIGSPPLGAGKEGRVAAITDMAMAQGTGRPAPARGVEGERWCTFERGRRCGAATLHVPPWCGSGGGNEEEVWREQGARRLPEHGLSEALLRAVLVGTADGGRLRGAGRGVGQPGCAFQPPRRPPVLPRAHAHTVRRASADEGGTARAVSLRRSPRRLATRTTNAQKNPRGARRQTEARHPPSVAPCSSHARRRRSRGAARNSWRPHGKGGYGGSCPDTKSQRGPTCGEADDGGG